MLRGRAPLNVWLPGEGIWEINTSLFTKPEEESTDLGEGEALIGMTWEQESWQDTVFMAEPRRNGRPLAGEP